MRGIVLSIQELRDSDPHFVAVPWRRLATEIRPHSGNVVMLIAAPSVGKSTFALQWALLSAMPTLYLSPDTDERTLTEQAVSMTMRTTREQTRLAISKRHPALDDVGRRLEHIVFDFTSTPTVKSVTEQIEALTSYWGHGPRLLIVDTVADVGKESGYEGWHQLFLDLRGLARHYDLCVVACHHVKGGRARDGRHPPMQSDAKYGADEHCEIMLGFHRNSKDQVILEVLKNRAGRRGQVLPFDPRPGFTGLEEVEEA